VQPSDAWKKEQLESERSEPMKKPILACVALTAIALVAPPVLANQREEERLQRLEEKLREQEQKLAALAEQRAGAPSAFQAYWKDGVRLETPDKAFGLKIGGRIHNDWMVATEDDDIKSAAGSIENGAEFRRARLYLEGLLYQRIEFKAEYDFAGGETAFKDVYVGVLDLPVLGDLRLGHFKEPFSLEELTSSNYVTFMERGLPNAFAPSRNTGFMLRDHAQSERLTWAAGVFREADEFGNSRGDGGFSFTGRLTALPWYAEAGRYLAHLGLAYSFRNPNDDETRWSARPEAHLAPSLVNTGTLAADSAQLLGLEAAIVYGAASVQGEYIYAKADTPGADPDLSGFYVYASYFLTGENRPYKTAEAAFDKVKPIRNFAFGETSGPGAWEVAARYSRLDLNDAAVRGGRLDDFTAGLNWYLNPNVRFSANYVFADRDEVGKAHIGEMRFELFL